MIESIAPREFDCGRSAVFLIKDPSSSVSAFSVADAQKSTIPRSFNRNTLAELDISEGFKALAGVGFWTAIDINASSAETAEISRKFIELGSMQSDWNSYGAAKISEVAIRTARSLCNYLLTLQVPAPSIVPTNNGGVQLEWHTKDLDFEIETEPNGEIKLYFEDLQAEEVVEEKIGDNWSMIDKFAKRLIAIF